MEEEELYSAIGREVGVAAMVRRGVRSSAEEEAMGVRLLSL